MAKSFESVEGKLVMPSYFKFSEFETVVQLPATIKLDGGNLLDWEIIGNSGSLGTKSGNNYYVPLTIAGATQSKTQNILIGSNPLTGGRSISKTSTSTEIECYSGENTFDVSSGTKPRMRIKYKYFSWR